MDEDEKLTSVFADLTGGIIDTARTAALPPATYRGTPGFTAASEPARLEGGLQGLTLGAIPNDFEAFGMLIESNPGISFFGDLADRWRTAQSGVGGLFRSFAVDPDFNPFEGDYLKGWEGHEQAFLDTSNRIEADVVKERLRERAQREQALQAYNPTLLQELLAGVATPEVLIPLSKASGLAGIRSVLVPAAEAGVLTAGIEVLRRQADPTVPLWESIMNTGAATLFTGAFAAAGLGIRKAFGYGKDVGKRYAEGQDLEDEGRSAIVEEVSRETEAVAAERGQKPSDGEQSPSIAEEVAARDEAEARIEAKAAADPDRWQIFGTGLGALGRWKQMPWYVLNLNRLPGVMRDYASWLSHAFADTPGLQARGSAAGVDALPVSVETAWKTRWRGVTAQMKRQVDRIYWDMVRGREPGGDVATRLLETKDWLSRQGRRVRRVKTPYVERKEFGTWLTLYRAKGEAPAGMPEHLLDAIKKAAEVENEFYVRIGKEASSLGLFGLEGARKRLGRLQRQEAYLQRRAMIWTERMNAREIEGKHATAAKIARIVEEILASRDETRTQMLAAADVMRRLKGEPGAPSPSGIESLFGAPANSNVLWEAPRPKGTANYVPVLFNRGAIARHRDAFIQRLAEHFRREGLFNPQTAGERAARVTRKIIREDATEASIRDAKDAAAARQEARDRAADERQRDLSERLQELVDEQDADTYASVFLDALMQAIDMVNQPIEVVRMNARGEDEAWKRAWVLKERTLNINHDDFREFVVTDADDLRMAYMSQMAPQMEMARAFEDPQASKAFEELGQHYDQARERVLELPEEKQDAELAALEAEYKRTRQAVTDLRDQVLGTTFLRYSPGSLSSRGLDMMASAAIVAQMGRSWQVQLIDAGKTVFTHGFKKTIGHMWSGLISRAEKEIRRMNRADMEFAGQALETALLQTRVEAAHGYGGLLNYMNTTEQRLGRARNWMHFLNGMTVTTDILKRFVGNMAQTRLLEAAEAVRFGKATPEQLAYLRGAHIDDEIAIAISKEAERYGAVSRDNRVANLTAWKDTKAAGVYAAALSDIADRTIITPGSADRPLFMSAPLWRTILLYKGFSIATTQRLLGAGVQQRDLKVLQGVGTMMAMGYLVDMLRAPAYDDRSVLSPERMDRAFTLSGLGGIFSDMNDTLEMASGNELGLGPLLGLDPMFEDPAWSQRWGSIAGAAVQPWMMIAWAFSDSEAKSSDKAKAVRRVLPFNNLWFWNDWFTRMQEDLSTGIDALE